MSAGERLGHSGDGIHNDTRQHALCPRAYLHYDDAGPLRVLPSGRPNFNRRSTTGITCREG